MKELIIKKCAKCGAMIEVLQDCKCKGCGIMCCEQPMQVVKPNSVDASFEKHCPTYKVVENQILVTVNHVMDDAHYVEWVALVGDGKVGKKFFVPHTDAQVLFPYIPGSTLYAYCNLHGLWSTQVK